MTSTRTATRVALTRIPDSWRWMAPDFRMRLLPFLAVSVVVYVLWRPSWMGVRPGDLGDQLAVGLIGGPVAFVAGGLRARGRCRRRGAAWVPRGAAAAGCP